MTRRRLLFFLIIIAAALCSYASCITGEFVFDDIPLIVENHLIKDVGNIPEILGLTGKLPYYRPVRMVSYALDYRLFGLDPRGYHVTNIVLHLATAWLVFLVVLHLARDDIIALSAALLFTVHPVNTESVAYISGRRDLLSTLFYMLGFYLFLRYRATRKALLYPGIIAAFLLALGSKEMAATLPAVFLTYDIVVHFNKTSISRSLSHMLVRLFAAAGTVVRKYALFYAPFVIAACAFLYFKAVVHPPSHGLTYYGGHVWTNFFTVARVIVHYLKLFLVPVTLNADYSFNAFPVTLSVWDIRAWGACAIVSACIWWAIKMLGHSRMLFFALMWFFITLLPVCHIIPHHELLAERYLYLPGIGIFFLGSTLVYNLVHTKSPRVFVALVLIIAVLFSARTVKRTGDWENGRTLWEKTVITAPGCARAWNNLGSEYYKENNHEKAQHCYDRAITIKQDYPDPYHNLGNIAADQNRFDKAIDFYKKAYTYAHPGIKPRLLNSWGVLYNRTGKIDIAEHLFLRALAHDPFFSEALSNLAAVLLSKGRYPAARKALIRALNRDPLSFEAYNNLGVLYKKEGNFSMAAAAFETAIRLNPDFMEAHYNRGNAFKAQGLYDQALHSFHHCLSLNPDRKKQALIYTNMGSIYIKKGTYDTAIQSLDRALACDPRLALPHLNLASIYLYRKKSPEKALFHLKKTLELDPDIAQAEAVRKKIARLQ